MLQLLLLLTWLVFKLPVRMNVEHSGARERLGSSHRPNGLAPYWLVSASQWTSGTNRPHSNWSCPGMYWVHLHNATLHDGHISIIAISNSISVVMTLPGSKEKQTLLSSTAASDFREINWSKHVACFFNIIRLSPVQKRKKKKTVFEAPCKTQNLKTHSHWKDIWHIDQILKLKHTHIK